MSFFEHKTLASLKIAVELHANAVQIDITKRVEDVDVHHPRSTFAQELVSNVKYFVLVSGLFASISSDFNSLVDFIARGPSPCTQSSLDILKPMSFSHRGSAP